MAQTNITEIRELTTEELISRLRDLKQESLNLRLQQATGQLENTARVRQIRRDVARIQTIARVKQAEADAS